MTAALLAALLLPSERGLNRITDEQIARSWANLRRLEDAAERSQA